MTPVLGSLVYRGSVLLQQPVAWSDKMSIATKLAVGESSDIDRSHVAGSFFALWQCIAATAAQHGPNTFRIATKFAVGEDLSSGHVQSRCLQCGKILLHLPFVQSDKVRIVIQVANDESIGSTHTLGKTAFNDAGLPRQRS